VEHQVLWQLVVVVVVVSCRAHRRFAPEYLVEHFPRRWQHRAEHKDCHGAGRGD